jgi:hypothetical protein
MTTIEQSAELNHFIDPSIPWTWEARWSKVKYLAPLLVVGCLFLMEQGILAAWLHDLPIPWFRLVGLAAVMPCALFLLVEVLIRIDHKQRRVFRLDERGMKVSPAKYCKFGWGQVVSIWLERIEANNELAKLTIQYKIGPKTKMTRRWSMVLNRSTQLPVLENEYSRLSQVNGNSVLIEMRETEPQSRNARALTKVMCYIALAMLFFCHGMPLCFVGSGLANEHRDGKTPTSAHSHNSEKMGRWIIAHFSSLAQFRHSLVITGGSCLALSGLFYFLAIRQVPKATESRPGASITSTEYNGIRT